MDKNTVEIIRAIKENSINTSDRVCLKCEELTLSSTAVAVPLPFTGIAQSFDVKAVHIKVKKIGSPADSSNLVRYTQAPGDSPTTTHGMWMGDGDYFEVTNKTNISNLKFIAVDALFAILTIEYYG